MAILMVILQWTEKTGDMLMVKRVSELSKLISKHAFIFLREQNPISSLLTIIKSKTQIDYLD